LPRDKDFKDYVSIPMTQDVYNIFLNTNGSPGVIERLSQWLEKKPTGEFSLHIFVNQGGIRERPEIGITEKL